MRVYSDSQFIFTVITISYQEKELLGDWRRNRYFNRQIVPDTWSMKKKEKMFMEFKFQHKISIFTTNCFLDDDFFISIIFLEISYDHAWKIFCVFVCMKYYLFMMLGCRCLLVLTFNCLISNLFIFSFHVSWCLFSLNIISNKAKTKLMRCAQETESSTLTFG